MDVIKLKIKHYINLKKFEKKQKNIDKLKKKSFICLLNYMNSYWKFKTIIILINC